MTGKKDGPDQPAVDSGSKRVHATLDLKATEVPAGAARAEAKATASAGPAASSGANAQTAQKVANAAQAVAANAAAAAAANAARPSGATTVAGMTGATAGKPATGPAAAAVAISAAPPRSRGGFISHAAAGVIGGLLAMLGADLVKPYLGQLGLPHATDPAIEATTKRLAAVEQAMAQRPAAAPVEVMQKLAAAEQRLARVDELARSMTALGETQARLAAESKALAEKLAKGTGADATDRVAKLEETLATMAKAADADPQRAGRLPQLAQLTGKVADLEAALTSRATALRRDLLGEVESKLGTAHDAAEAAKSGAQRIEREMTAAKTEAARLGQRMEALKAGNDRLEQTLRVVQEETGSLRAGLDGLKGDLDVKLKAFAKPVDVSQALAPVAGKIAALESSVQGVVKNEAERRSNAERIVLALELANLKRAMDRGAGFKTELAEVRKVAGDKLDLRALEAHQDKGVPALSDLTRDFRPLVAAMIDADAEPADAGVVDRLLSGARSIVRVRKTAHAADDKSAEAIVGRIEAALKDARLGDIVEAAKGLAPQALRPAAGWLQKVEARQSVDKALAGIEIQLKASLGAAASEKGTK